MKFAEKVETMLDCAKIGYIDKMQAGLYDESNEL